MSTHARLRVFTVGLLMVASGPSCHHHHQSADISLLLPRSARVFRVSLQPGGAAARCVYCGDAHARTITLPEHWHVLFSCAAFRAAGLHTCSRWISGSGFSSWAESSIYVYIEKIHCLYNVNVFYGFSSFLTLMLFLRVYIWSLMFFIFKLCISFHL